MAVGTPLAAQTPLQTPTQVPVLETPESLARIAIAKRLASRLLPDGTYRKMMSGTMDQMMNGMVSQMTDMPMRSLAEAGGLPNEKLAKLGDGTVKQMMAILDPAFEQRTQLIVKSVTGGMIDLMSKMEPNVREGLAEAYAKRFTGAQLADLETFFATPTGSQYAEQSMLVYTDPAVVTRIQSMVPEILKSMPMILKKVEAATAGLPKPKRMVDLSKAEKASLAKLMAIDPRKLK